MLKVNDSNYIDTCMPILTTGVNEVVNKMLMLIDELKNSLVRAAYTDSNKIPDKIHKNYVSYSLDAVLQHNR